MKKFVSSALALMTIASAVTLSGCGSSVKKRSAVPPPTAEEKQETRTDLPDTVEIDIGGTFGNLGRRLPIVGVRNRLPSISGFYTVEYVHGPRDEAPDPTLKYELMLRDDNTYEMNVTTDGVFTEHYGNWYIHNDGNIVLYYDEPLDPQAHNVYVGDSMYCEVLPQGKIMVYDDCKTIVLSRKSDEVITPMPYAPRPGIRLIARKFSLIGSDSESAEETDGDFILSA